MVLTCIQGVTKIQLFCYPQPIETGIRLPSQPNYPVAPAPPPPPAPPTGMGAPPPPPPPPAVAPVAPGGVPPPPPPGPPPAISSAPVEVQKPKPQEVDGRSALLRAIEMGKKTAIVYCSLL